MSISEFNDVSLLWGKEKSQTSLNWSMLSDLVTNLRGDVHGKDQLIVLTWPVYLLKESSLEMCWVMVSGFWRANEWLWGINETDGKEYVPMSKPWSILVRIDWNHVYKLICNRIDFHLDATRGVMMGNKSDKKTQLCIVGWWAAQCTQMFPFQAGFFICTVVGTIPCKAKETFFLVVSAVVWWMPLNEARGSTDTGGGCAILGEVSSRTVSAENAFSTLGVIVLVTKIIDAGTWVVKWSSWVIVMWFRVWWRGLVDAEVRLFEHSGEPC